MPIAVLTSTESLYWKDLLRAAKADYELVAVSYRNLSCAIGGEITHSRFMAGKIDLRNCEAVLVRAMPPGSLEQVVLRMDLLAELERSGVPVVNPAKSCEIAVDKFLCTARLVAANIPVPRTFVAQSADEAVNGFDQLGGDVVLKPLFGSEGRGLVRLTDRDLAHRAFSLTERLDGAIYIQEFIDHGDADYRVLIIGNKSWAVRRRHPAGDWRTNVSRGAIAEHCELDDSLIQLAFEAVKATGVLIAGVDIMLDRTGKPYVIEVNAVPGWRGLASALDIDIAREVLEYLRGVSKEII
jgi:ribosomal protein S6--L-glutamate ligase